MVDIFDTVYMNEKHEMDEDIIYGPFPKSTIIPSSPINVKFISNTFDCSKIEKPDIHYQLRYYVKYLVCNRTHSELVKSISESLIQSSKGNGEYSIQLPHLVRLDTSENNRYGKTYFSISPIQSKDNSHPSGEYSGKLMLKLTDAKIKWNEQIREYEVKPKQNCQLYHVHFGLYDLRCIKVSPDPEIENKNTSQMDLMHVFRPLWERFKAAFHMC